MIRALINNYKKLGYNNLEKQITFNDSVEFYKPIYFHFLDGFINENVGDALIHFFLYKHRDYLLYDKIRFIEMNITTQKMSLSFLNFKNEKEDKTIDIENKNNDFIITDDIYDNIIHYLNYSIFNHGADNHATSIIFMIKNDSLFVCSFNSGLGIDKHFEYDNSYLPYYAIRLIDNIHENKQQTIRKLLTIFFIKKLYELKNVFNAYKNKQNVNILFVTLKILETIVTDFSQLDIGIILNDIHITVTDFIINFHQMQYEDAKIFLNIPSYYELLIKIFKQINREQHNFNIEPEFQKKYNSLFNHINKNIKSKIIPKFIDDKLLIQTQESGSCSWFSIYWPLVYYNVIYESNYDNYCGIIVKIYDFFYDLLQIIYTPEIFMIEYNTFNSNIYLMKKLCTKFINLELLDNKILIDQIDFIYKLDFKLEYTEFTNDDNFINIYKKENYKNISDNLNNFNNIIKRPIEEYLIVHKIYFKIYNTFLSYDYKDNIFFKEFKSDKTIEELINDFTLKHKTNYELNKQFFQGKIYNRKLNELCKVNEDNKKILIKFINEFNKTFNDEIKEPNYIYQYIHIFRLINNFDKEYNPNNHIDLDDNLLLIKLIKFAHRYFILFCIYRFLINNYFFNESTNIDLSMEYKLMEDLFIDFFKLIYYKLNINDSEEIKIIVHTSNNITNKNFIINLSYINNFIPILDLFYTDKIIPNFMNYNRTISDYEKLIIYLYENPKYIYCTFNNNDIIIDNNIFIKMNIYDLFKKENEHYRDNLILFYSNHFWEKYNKIKDIDDCFYIIINLYLLIYKNICRITSNIIDIKFYNYFSFKYSDINYTDFIKMLINIFNEQPNKEKFCEFIKTNKKDLHIKVNNTVYYLLEKYFKGFTINSINKNIYGFNNDEFLNIDYIPSNLNNFFDIKDNSYFFINEHKTKFYIINIYYYILLNIEYSKLTQTFKIISIEYNNNKIIKYSELKYPWKYVIPTNCFHLIYDNKIVYFVKNILRRLEEEEDKLFLKNVRLNNFYEITINENNLLFPIKNNTLNFIYLCTNFEINNWNIIYINELLTFKESGIYLKKKYYELFHFDKTKFFKRLLSDTNSYDKINLLNYSEEKEDIIFDDMNDIQIQEELLNNERMSLLKLRSKIVNCKLGDIRQTRININKKIKYFELYINNNSKHFLKNCRTINNLFDSSFIYNYLLHIKGFNYCNKIKDIINDDKTTYNEKEIILCSQIKIFDEYFDIKKKEYKYYFEYIFELFAGFEIFDEQMNRYINIINDYSENSYNVKNKINNSNTLGILKPQYIINGGNNIYPLHHFMMGKGKSAVLTPLLLLYFSIVYDKHVYIIVPKHLERQTNDVLQNYVLFFNIKNFTIINDINIKNEFLESKFNNLNENKKKIFIFDEFDYLIDPIKSNFNLITNKDIPVIEICKFLLPIVEKMDKTTKKITDIEDVKKYNCDIIDLFITDINNVLKLIKNDKLIENINWGIDPNKLYAIPYLNKDHPLDKSHFSSFIVTCFLTIYYYFIYNNYEITDNAFKCIIKFDIYTSFFNIETPLILTPEIINKSIEQSNDPKLNRKLLFNEIILSIFKNYFIPGKQYNTSLVDIINIDNIYKIGYSGTLNIDLPILKTEFKFDDSNKTIDNDENTNVKYAILNSTIIKNSKNPDLLEFLCEINLSIYDAIIDICGLFKNYKNINIVEKINIIFNNKRNIIFIDEQDKNYVLMNGKIYDYNINDNYNNPFIYYSQAHLVGIDIRQDLYPIMNGLCFINKNITYTQVAQSIFRLRKLNMGHKITFIDINNKITSVTELLKLFITNEETEKINKEKYLTYQTIKSEIRKNKEDLIFKKRYEETKKYYFIDQISNDINDILNGIIITDEIDSNNLNELFNKIKDPVILFSIVYHIENNLSIEQEQ